MKEQLKHVLSRAFSLAVLAYGLTSCQPETVDQPAQPVSKNSGLATARVGFVPASETLESVKNGIFYLVNRNSGKVLDVLGAQTSDGSDVVQYGGAGGNNQKWRLTQLANGSYSIVGFQSGKSLEVQQANKANGANVSIATYKAAAYQLWRFVPTGDGYYQIINQNSGKALDVLGLSTDDLGDITQWDYLGGLNQQWALVTTQAGGQLNWQLTTANVPGDVRKRITAAMNDACARYNAIAKWPARTLTVEYLPGVPTADGNTNGNIRFGSEAGYQNTRTAMHEIAHTWGVGISEGWYANTRSGPFTGANAVALMKTFDGPDAVINTGGGHFWPYGLNYDNEWSELGAYRHVKLVYAMRTDGM